MKNKDTLAIVSTFLIILSVSLSLKISSGLNLGGYLFRKAGLPVMTNGNSGFYIPSLIITALLILGIILFRYYFKKHASRSGNLIFIGMIALIILCQPVYNIASTVIRCQYSGLKAVDYNKAESICNYNFAPDNFIECRCTLKFINYSHEPQKFHINPKLLQEQIEEHLRKYTDIKEVELVYDKENVVFLPQTQISIFSKPILVPAFFEFRLKITDGNSRVNGGGTINGLNIIIFNSDEERSFFY